MKIAILTTDNREHLRQYDSKTPWFGTAPEALLQGFAMLQEHEVHVVTCTQKPMNSPERLAPNIIFHSLLVPKIGWLRTGYQGCVRVIREKLREISPDIVHGQGTERECAMSAIFSSFPNVVTIHGNMAAIARLLHARIGSYYWLAGKLEDFALPRTAGVFCNSAYTESLVKPRSKKTWRVPNPLRRDFFEPAPTHPQNRRPVILNVGNICERKQQINVLKALRGLYARGCDFEIHFIGQCPNDAYGKAFQADLATATDFASYSGMIKTADLISRFDAADALLHFPSEEAFGLVVAESMARNLKFFGSNLGGVAEIASGVEGAELIGDGDWDGLAATIGKWIAGGAPRPVASDREMRLRYHPETIARHHVEIYREVAR